MDVIGYWIERVNQAYAELDRTKLDKKALESIVYAASRLVSEMEEAARVSARH